MTTKVLLKDVSNFGKWYGNFENSCTLLSKVVELWQLSQLYNFAKLQKLPKVEVDVFLMRPGFSLRLVEDEDWPKKGLYDW